MEQETTAPLPGEPGSHAWMLDYLGGLGGEQMSSGFGWGVTRSDRWATLAVTYGETTYEWRLVPVDREERRKVDGSG